MNPEVQKYYLITLLGKPFSYMDVNMKIHRGYEFDGKKYYLGE